MEHVRAPSRLLGLQRLLLGAGVFGDILDEQSSNRALSRADEHCRLMRYHGAEVTMLRENIRRGPHLESSVRDDLPLPHFGRSI